MLAILSLLLSGSALAQGPGSGASDATPRWITLGTMGGPIPRPDRSQPANALVVGGDVILVDAGDGTAGQLARAGIMLPRVKALFLSHLHFDHTGGVAAILGLRYQTSVPGKLAIYGPPGTKAFIDGLLASMKPAVEAGYGLADAPSLLPEDMVSVVELRDGASLTLGSVKVMAAKNSHYSFAHGSAMDRKFESLSFRFDAPGRSIAYTGDTGPSPAVERLSKGVDLLVSEMIDVPMTVENVKRNTPDMTPEQMAFMTRHLSDHHLTPEQVGELAARAGAKSVVVTHFVAPSASADQLAAYLSGIGKSYSGPAKIASDLERF